VRPRISLNARAMVVPPLGAAPGVFMIPSRPCGRSSVTMGPLSHRGGR
jgi:hypothetical protein